MTKWRTKKVGDCLTIKHGRSQKEVECKNGEYPILGTGGEIGKTNTFLCDKPSVLIGRKGTIDKPQYMDTPFWTVDTLFYSDVHDDMSAKFLFYVFNTIDWMNYNEASGVPSLSASTVSSIKIRVPEFTEQEAIVEEVKKFDDYLEKVEKKLEASRRLKKGLAQQIFSGKLRFKDDNGQDFPDWVNKKIGEITVERIEKTVDNNQHDILTSSRKGIFKQDEYFGKNVASKDNVGYKIIHNGDFVYRTMTDDDTFVFNYNDKFEIGLVSPAYAVFYIRGILPSILRELLNGETVACQLLSVIQGGTRKSLKFSSLKTIRLKIPALDEQQKIADFLSNIDEMINLLEQLLESAKNQKKWLLDNLVTGNIRLKEFRDE